MTAYTAPGSLIAAGHHHAASPASFSVPARHNPRLQALVDRINADDELRQLWRCANVNAVDRLGLSDHGETHIRIVANASLRLLRLLGEAGQTPGVVAAHGLAREDAEVLVVLAAALHDVGLAVHAERRAEFGLALAHDRARDLLAGLYGVRERTLLTAEALHAIAAHLNAWPGLTLEAGILRLADALDMTKGRARTPEAADSGLPALAAASIEEVSLRRGESRPVRIEIRLNQASGAPHAEDLLRRRLAGSPLAGLVESFARLETAADRRFIPLYTSQT